jgi:Skp family chaperone for outer membrane proteins
MGALPALMKIEFKKLSITEKFQMSGYIGYRRATWFLMVLSVLALAPAAFAQKAGVAPAFGSVDVDQVLNESKARQQDISTLNGIVNGLRDVMMKVQENGGRFLTEPELKELADLYQKRPVTDADKKRIADFEAKGQDKIGLKRRLENTAAPTDEQKKQYADLNDQEQKGQGYLKNLNDEFSRVVDAKNVELSNKTVLAIKQVIGKIAQDKGLAVVFDSKVAIYTANDITQDVIKSINK